MLFRRKKPSASSLDDVLFRLTPNDILQVLHLLTSILVLGRTGSGKSSGSGRTLMWTLARHLLSAGCVLCSKPEDLGEWLAAFRAAGRMKDVAVIEPGGAHRMNFLGYLSRTEDAWGIVRGLMAVKEVLRTSDTKGGENADFFEQQMERQSYNAVVIVKAATGGVSAPELQRFIAGAARNPQQLADPAWQAGNHNQLIRKALANAKPGREEHDVKLGIEYWLGELPGMADKTRSSIEVGTFGLLHALNVGIVRELLSEDTTVSPDDVLAGKWLIVNMPPAEYGDSGACVNAALKYAMQRRMLKRVFSPGEPFCVIYADEAQQFVNSYDSVYLAQCRSHGGGMVYLTQSLAAFYAALHGEKGKHQVNALVSNFGLKVLHSLGSFEDAQFAANLVGKERKIYLGGSVNSANEDMWDSIVGPGNGYSGSFNQQLQYILEPQVFMNGLRTGGPANGFLVDAICVRSAEPFSNNRNFIRVTFSQR